MITIRIALNTDIEEIQSLYRNTVLVINRRDYSQAEVESRSGRLGIVRR